ncbi:hypothetical protein SDC9_150046 [bioreactor metagenome]|uniref:Uncharacterized protein n=1 Tax=bioreactor metagenome TaxID=1076179 RepID=A0A645ELE1_9ZZZZ
MKLIPGAGTVTGGAIGAAVASSFTYAMGEAWLAVVERVAAGGLRGLDGMLDTEQIRGDFLAELRRRVPRLR